MSRNWYHRQPLKQQFNDKVLLEPVSLSGKIHVNCRVCGEKIRQKFDQDKEEWIGVDRVIQIGSDHYFHISCLC